jgi:hypothetical protein
MISHVMLVRMLTSPAYARRDRVALCPQIREEMVVSVAQPRDGIASEPSEPTIPSFVVPPTLAELDGAKLREGTILSHAVRRAQRERRHPSAVRGGFDNKV